MRRARTCRRARAPHADGLPWNLHESIRWICERELRQGQGGRFLHHLLDGVFVSNDDRGRQWGTALEVELTRRVS